MIGRAALLLALAAGQADAAVVHFCWQGANGYSMIGRMEFPDRLRDAALITQDEVTGFRITGYRDGRPIGSWDLADRQPGQTWYLRFMPRLMLFPTDGLIPGPFDQGWNADGTAANCGAGGFGFNAGNYAQDFCLDGTWVEESGVPPPTPFLARAEPPASPDCGGPPLLGKRRAAAGQGPSGRALTSEPSG